MEEAFEKAIEDAFAYADTYFTGLTAVAPDNGRNDRLQNMQLQDPDTMTALFPQGWIGTKYSDEAVKFYQQEGNDKLATVFLSRWN